MQYHDQVKLCYMYHPPKLDEVCKLANNPMLAILPHEESWTMYLIQFNQHIVPDAADCLTGCSSNWEGFILSKEKHSKWIL